MADTMTMPRFRNPQGSISGLLQQLFTDMPSEAEFVRGMEARELDLREQKSQAELEQQRREQGMLAQIAQKYRATLEGSGGDHKAAVLEVLPDIFTLPSSTTANAMRANLEMIQQLALPRQVLSEGQTIVDPLSGETIVGQVPRLFAPQTLSPGQVLVDPNVPAGERARELFSVPAAETTTQQAQQEAFNKEFAKTATQHIGGLLEEGTDAQLDKVTLDRLDELGDPRIPAPSLPSAPTSIASALRSTSAPRRCKPTRPCSTV